MQCCSENWELVSDTCLQREGSGLPRHGVNHLLAAQGQGKVGSAACEAMARNPAARPHIQLALIPGLAFIEPLVLFTLVIIFVKVV